MFKLEENKKIGFFKRVKMAIFNLEKYEIFANERFSKAFKYLLLLIVIVTIFLAVATTVNLSNEAGRFIDFFKSEEFPDFELTDGKLVAKSKLNAYDEEFDSRLIIDTTEDLSDEKLEEYKKQAKASEYSVILLKDKIIYRFDETLENGLESTYNNFTSSLGLKDLNKKDFVKNYLNDDTLLKVKIIMFFYSYLTILLLNILTLLEDLLIVGIFGWLAAKISKVKLTLTKAFSLTIYSLTLSIILSTIYSIVRTFTGFEIKYFEIMYMIIAYIYIVAAIMIMKDFNRAAGEAVTVEGEVLKTGDEEEKEEEEKDKKDKEDKEDKKEKLPEKKDKENEEIPNENKDKNETEKNDKGEN